MYKKTAIIFLSVLLWTSIYEYTFSKTTEPLGRSEWVWLNAENRLEYKTTERGDRIMDFSHAGYMGGGVAFPYVPVRVTVRPIGNGADDVDNIQAAIDSVAAMPKIDGFRGAVLLEPGKYYISRSILISVSGIVLRGSGSHGPNASTLWMNGPGRYPAININCDVSRRSGRGGSGIIDPNDMRTFVTDDFVPSGVNTINVASTEGFAVGDMIQVRRPTTAEWVELMEMHNLVRNGNPQTWIPLTRYSVFVRRIVAIDGLTVTLDVPLSDSFDSQYLGRGTVQVVRVGDGEPLIPLSQIGVERLRIECLPMEISYLSHPYAGIRIGGQDIWVDDVHCVETMNTIVITGRRVTVRNTHVFKTHPNLGASKPADFSMDGAQILLDRVSSNAENTYWVWTNSYDNGPNVVLNSNFTGRGSRIQPHMRWATGNLVDNCRAPDGGIDFSNRGVAGSGHGWCMGWGVVWNSVASFFIIQNPPGALNWAIGNIGDRRLEARYFDTEPILPEGIFESHGVHVTPRSLYLAQLAERLGEQALVAIGYGPGSPGALSLENPVMPLPRPQPPTPIDPEFGFNLAFLRPVNTNSVHPSDTDDPRKFGGEKALDGNPETYWMPAENRSGQPNHNIEADTEGPIIINAVVLSEPAGKHNVRSYRVEGFENSRYTLLAEGTTIGERTTHVFPDITVWKVRLTIIDSDGLPAIRELSFFHHTD